MNTPSRIGHVLEPGEVAQLLRRCRANDSSAWDCLLAHVRQVCLETAGWKYRMSRDDAEDLAQLAGLRVIQRMDQVRDPQAFTAWLLRLVHRSAIDMLRRRRPLLEKETALEAADFQADAESPVRYSRIDLRADLDAALARLPELYRLPIELHLLEGMPQDEIGEVLGRPRNTVASQIDRGLRRLRKSVSPALAL